MLKLPNLVVALMCVIFSLSGCAPTSDETGQQEDVHLRVISEGPKGGDLFEQKRYPEAIAFYGDLLKQYPKNSSIYFNRGTIYNLLGQYDKAKDDYSKVLEMTPNDLDVCLQRGEMFFKMGRYEKAVDDFTQEIDIITNRKSKGWDLTEVQPESFLIHAYLGRAKSYTKLGKEDLASADENKVASLSLKKL